MSCVPMDDRTFIKIIEFLGKDPAIHGAIGKGADDGGHRWVKFESDISHEFSWHTFQGFGHVLTA